ncbi:uncharacterized protein C8orf76 homolog [Clupea harengus]|uniref:Uncharacterized protein C8orf76 homolog n=1 Tax=Clupea harengus TaxID=7950 RepID=A0A8M1KDG4_CLUHA|nr:uncharacterized protein C8orf76 homolog [Clupea harengus]
MEILGSNFDDSVFAETRNRVSVVLPSYNAKFCEAQWFCEDADTDDMLEKQKVYKFRADLAYRRKQYQTALSDYTTCLSLIPVGGNMAIKRDVLEGMARCSCQLGRPEQAQELTEKLRKEASNTCQLSCVLAMELSIAESLGNGRAAVGLMQQLCSLHPFNPWHWLKLAAVCHARLDSLGATASPGASSADPVTGPLRSEEETGPMEPQREKRELWLKACMGFIRTRLLVAILRIQQSSFVLQTSERAVLEADEALLRLEPSERTVQVIEEVMSEDLNPETMREENHDGESLVGLSVKDFEEHWWDGLVCAGLLKEEEGPGSGTEDRTQEAR